MATQITVVHARFQRFLITIGLVFLPHCGVYNLSNYLTMDKLPVIHTSYVPKFCYQLVFCPIPYIHFRVHTDKYIMNSIKHLQCEPMFEKEQTDCLCMQHAHKYCFWTLFTSLFLFEIQCSGDWILSSPSAKTYLVGPN
jgi:hypothetical protein